VERPSEDWYAYLWVIVLSLYSFAVQVDGRVERKTGHRPSFLRRALVKVVTTVSTPVLIFIWSEDDHKGRFLSFFQWTTMRVPPAGFKHSRSPILSGGGVVFL